MTSLEKIAEMRGSFQVRRGICVQELNDLLSAIAEEIERDAGDKYSEPDLGDLRALASILRGEKP